jgi:hypothetical protein
MPAGIPKRLTDKMGELGYTLETYTVDGPPFEPGDEPLPCLTGIEVKHHGRLVGVAEHKPRGWDGDGKWYTYPDRCPVGGVRGPLSAPYGRHNRQRDAIADLLRNEQGLI